jgi:NitT/TauT family transport system ATP-binding protein
MSAEAVDRAASSKDSAPSAQRDVEDRVSTPGVHLQGLTKIYRTRRGDVHALENISFTVADRQFVTVVGPSGCGKSTILKILAGLIPQSSGTVEVFGEAVQGPAAEVGMIFQEPVLLPWKDVTQNVLFPIEILRKDTRKYQDKALEILNLVGLEGFEHRHPAELSGGMQQRVAMARALVHDPRLLLMDEPFGALDQLTRQHMNLELLRIWSQMDKTTVLITHDIEEAVFLGDRVVIMTPRPGRVAEVVDIELPRPRNLKMKMSREFGELVMQVGELLGLDYGR